MKSFTDVEQSKKLAEILPVESADAHYVRESTDLMGNPVDGKWSEIRLGNPEKANYIVQNFSSYEILPCWSLAALLDVLPEGVIEKYYAPNLQKENGKYSIAYGNEKLLCIADNPIDCCMEIILKLHEQKLIEL